LQGSWWQRRGAEQAPQIKDDKQLHEGKKTKRGTRPGGLKRSEMVGATSEQKYHIHKGDIC
jgi:hypothetical protein